MDTASIQRFCQEEYFNYHFYTWLAGHVPHSLKDLTRRLAEEEKEHYQFWQALNPGFQPRISKIKLLFYKTLYYLLGITFILRAFEKIEHETLNAYSALLDKLPPTLGEKLRNFIDQEQEHEKSFTEAISENEPRLKYIGFIVLGLADAIIEVTGVHAGFLGVSHRPLTAGIAGLIVGFAASISMGSAAYLQAKQYQQVRPTASAIYTGISYFLAVILLALPYFFTTSMMSAFLGSVGVALLLIAGFVYYSSVLFERNFRGEFLESSFVLGATAVLSYGFGELLSWLFPQANV
ncbi:MAG: rubrerythrin family protein [Bacteroidia bacterium]